MNAVEHIVVDIGNTRMKWGRVEGDRIVEKLAFAYEDEAAWEQAAQRWNALPGQTIWTYAHVHADRALQFNGWLLDRRHLGRRLKHPQIPVLTTVEQRDRVGMDRLLNALGVESKPAIVADAGSAVTVDAIARDGVFLGGSIFPGLRLMAEALHAYTAQLPNIDATPPAPALPAKNTEDAMHAGIVLAVAGGIVGCVAEMVSTLGEQTTIYLTGGDGPGLRPYLPFPSVEVPLLTLQGILNAARVLWP